MTELEVPSSRNAPLLIASSISGSKSRSSPNEVESAKGKRDQLLVPRTVHARKPTQPSTGEFDMNQRLGRELSLEMSEGADERAMILLDGGLAQKVGSAMNGGERGGDFDCAREELDHLEKEEAGGLGGAGRQDGE